LLGIEASPDEPVTISLSVGDRSVLMTDGLVERRSEAIDSTLEKIVEAVAIAAVPAEQLCDQLMDQWGHGEDDVCLIVLDILDAE